MDTLRPISVNEEITFHDRNYFGTKCEIANKVENRKKICDRLLQLRSRTESCKRNAFRENTVRIRSAPVLLLKQSTNKSSIYQRPHNVKINEWIGKAPTIGDKNRLQKESAAIDESFHQLKNQERSLIKDIHNILQKENSIRDQKNIQLHKQWTNDVFKPLTARLSNVMDKRRTDLHERQHHYQRYIDYLNKKGFVFLDIASTDDYSPIPKHANKMTKVALPLDPLEWQHDKAYIENEIADACINGIRAPLTDHKRKIESEKMDSLTKTDRGTWLSMELYDIQSNVRQRSQMKMTGQTNATSADFWMSNYRLQNDKTCQIKKYQKRAFNMKHHSDFVLV